MPAPTAVPHSKPGAALRWATFSSSGTMYSEAMGVNYLDESGERQLSSHGLLRHRHRADARRGHRSQPRRERHHLAGRCISLRCHVVALNLDQQPVADALDELERAFAAAHLSLLIDDRARLGGHQIQGRATCSACRYRLTVSPRALEKGGVELRERRTGETSIVTVGDAVERVQTGTSWLRVRIFRFLPQIRPAGHAQLLAVRAILPSGTAFLTEWASGPLFC